MIDSLYSKRVKHMDYNSYYTYGMDGIKLRGMAKFTGLDSNGHKKEWLVTSEDELIQLWETAKQIDGFYEIEKPKRKNTRQTKETESYEIEGCFGCLFEIIEAIFIFSCFIFLLFRMI